MRDPIIAGSAPLLALLLLVGIPGIARAADSGDTPPPVAEVSTPFGVAIDGAALGAIAGQSDVAQFINAENNSTVSRNTVSGNSVTGTIAFDAQAFQNMNGLSVLSANTGNNVAINSSLNVNVAIHP